MADIKTFPFVMGALGYQAHFEIKVDATDPLFPPHLTFSLVALPTTDPKPIQISAIDLGYLKRAVEEALDYTNDILTARLLTRQMNIAAIDATFDDMEASE